MGADASSVELLCEVKHNQSSTLKRQSEDKRNKHGEDRKKGKEFSEGPFKKKTHTHTDLQTFIRARTIPFSCATEWRLPVWSGQREILVGDSVAPASPKPQ